MLKATHIHTPNPRLARAARSCRRAEAAVNRLCDEYADLPDDLMDPLSKRQHRARDVALMTPATTLADICHKAEIALALEDIDYLSKEVLLDLLWLSGTEREVRA